MSRVGQRKSPIESLGPEEEPRKSPFSYRISALPLTCDRGSYQDRRKPTYVDPELRKGRRTRQTECPYQVKIRYLKRKSMWKVSEG